MRIKAISVLLAVCVALSCLPLAGAYAAAPVAEPQLAAVALETEYAADPIGIDEESPLFSWKIEKAGARGVMQVSYRVLVASDAAFGDVLWDSDVVETDMANAIRYNGEPLAALTKYYWKVYVTDNQGASAESAVASFAMGMLGSEENWGGAQWITNKGGNAPARETPVTVEYIDHFAGYDDGFGMFTGSMYPVERSFVTSVPLMRKEFTLADKPVKRAVAYASALGQYELQLNGAKVGDEYMAPGWTEYATRVQYQAYDVTAQLTDGENAIGAMLAPGWYTGNISNLKKNRYGFNEALIASLVIEYEDGTRQWVVTDDTWDYTMQGPIVATDMQDGEIYNAQWELGGSKYGWSSPAYDQAGDGWGDVAVRFDRAYGAVSEAGRSYNSGSVGQPGRQIALTAQVGPTVRQVRELRPASVREGTTQNGELPAIIVDMGQNFAGILRLTMQGNAGETVRIRYGELLNTDVGFMEFGPDARPKAETGYGDGVPGSVYTQSLRHARVTDHYIFKSDDAVTWEPNFTFHGFRYVEIVGDVEVEDIVGIALANGMEDAGTFESSDPLLNQIYSNTFWSQLGNFLSVPTDCPQRDERMGWGGDGVVFAETAMLNMDAMMVYQKWIQDIHDGQYADGRYPNVAPNPHNMNGDIIWGAPAVVIPYKLYQMTGDKRPLEDGYESMKRFMHYRTTIGAGRNHPNPEMEDPSLVQQAAHPDWLSAPAGTPDAFICGTLYYGFVLDTMISIAETLGHEDDAQMYRDRFDAVTQNFIDMYVDEETGTISFLDGRPYPQSGYFMALFAGMTTPELEPLFVDRLVEKIAQDGGLMSAGFVSVNMLAPTLQKYGYDEIAYDFALSEEFPSWGYSINQGATTIWERWDAYKADTGFHRDAMNSYNHYSFGSIISWFYKGMAGINYDEASPGYAHAIIEPVTDPRVESVSASHNSVRGRIASGWTVNQANGVASYDVSIPANSTATLIIEADIDTLKEGGTPVNGGEIPGITAVDAANGSGKLRIELGSGDYSFTAGVTTVGVTAEPEASYGDKADYVIAAECMDGVNLVDLTFTADAGMLDCAAAKIEGLNGFVVFNELKWTDLGNGLWQGNVILGLYDEATATGSMDIGRISFDSLKLGDAKVEITGLAVFGIDVDGDAADSSERASAADPASASIKVWSVYDVNGDNKVDHADLSLGFYYYLAKDGDPNWAAAKAADVDGSGDVDMTDLLAIYANYIA